MIILIDNYDSFTYNLFHILRGMVPEVTVVRNDAFDPEEIRERDPAAVVISPGPGRPENAGGCLAFIHGSSGTIPILGVCLGHQALAAATGVPIIPAPELVHGKVSRIRHRNSPLFQGIPSPFSATRYHSLVVDPDRVRDAWRVTAATRDGTVMAIEHRTYPWVGVQFHPESVLTPYGPRIIGNFLRDYAKLDIPHTAFPPLRIPERKEKAHE